MSGKKQIVLYNVYEHDFDACNDDDANQIAKKFNVIVIKIANQNYRMIGGKTKIREFIRSHYDEDDFDWAYGQIFSCP